MFKIIQIFKKNIFNYLYNLIELFNLQFFYFIIKKNIFLELILILNSLNFIFYKYFFLNYIYNKGGING